MGKHFFRMYAGIRAAGARGFYFLPKYGGKRFFQFLLHGDLSRLYLVAEIIFSVVRKLNKITQFRRFVAQKYNI